MKTFSVVSAFVHKPTGETILPGAVLPTNVDAATIARLVRAGCLVINADGVSKTLFNPAAPEAPQNKTFSAAGPAPLAGGDGAATGERAEPNTGRRKSGKRKGPRDRG